MVHIAEKESLFAEIFRVLRPGGLIAAGDRINSTHGPFSAAMSDYPEARASVSASLRRRAISRRWRKRASATSASSSAINGTGRSPTGSTSA